MIQAGASPTACPSEDDLACFMEGQSESAVADAIRKHVDTCEPCRLLVANALRAEAACSSLSPLAIGARTFPVGEVLNRRFRIDRFIAKGGMGEVYEAHDLQLGETVALKTIVCTGLDNARLFPRIRAEVQMARRITHSNVCRILEFGTTEPRSPAFEVVPYFTMEYLRGSTLKEYLRQHGRLPAAEVIGLATQILDGLAAVHAAGIVHRDLKTDNVFLVSQSTGALRVVVMDFGLARSTLIQDSSSGLSSDSLVGTPAYMAPEQTLGGTPTPAWDIFSVGVMVFELLAGQLPFVGKTAVAMAMARVRESAPPLSSLVPDVPPALESVVTRCLQTEPSRRFPSAITAREAFDRIRHSSTASTRRPSKRALLVAGGFGLGVGALMLGPVGHELRGDDEKSIEQALPAVVSTGRNPVAALGATAAKTTMSASRTGTPSRLTLAGARLEAAESTEITDAVPVRGSGDVRTPRRRAAGPRRLAPSAPPPSASEVPAETLDAPTTPVRMTDKDDLAIPEFARRHQRSDREP